MVIKGKKPKTFDVVFSDPNKTFYCSGDKVAGRVLVEVSELTKVRCIRVLGIGCAKVAYAKGKKKCREEVEYLRYEDTVHLGQEPADADGSFSLRPGQMYDYMFGFELPSPGRLVSSYSGKFGYVRYFVRAVMERPSQDPVQCERAFEVEEPLDVNTPDLMAPVASSKQQKLTCMFIPDGQVSISAQLDRKGFCEGEEICVNAKFENTCSRIVVPKAAIVARHTYQAGGGRQKREQRKLLSVRGDPIISGMCDMWQGRTLRVPKLQPSLKGCDLINVEYALLISLHIPGSQKLELELPLVIGTVPSGGLSSRTNSMSSQASQASSLGSPLCSPLSSAASLPSAPPSYSNIQRDLGLRADGRMPLLCDYDGEDDEDEEGGLFMQAPPYHSRPPPPAYSEVDEGQFCLGIHS